MYNVEIIAGIYNGQFSSSNIKTCRGKPIYLELKQEVSFITGLHWGNILYHFKNPSSKVPEWNSK
jgi:hypothetical protein